MADGKVTQVTDEEKKAISLLVSHAQREDTGLFTLEEERRELEAQDMAQDMPEDTETPEPVNLENDAKLSIGDPKFAFHTEEGSKERFAGIQIDIQLTSEIDDTVLKRTTLFWELDDAEEFQRELSREIGRLLAHKEKNEED